MIPCVSLSFLTSHRITYFFITFFIYFFCKFYLFFCLFYIQKNNSVFLSLKVFIEFLFLNCFLHLWTLSEIKEWNKKMMKKEKIIKRRKINIQEIHRNTYLNKEINIFLCYRICHLYNSKTQCCLNDIFFLFIFLLWIIIFLLSRCLTMFHVV